MEVVKVDNFKIYAVRNQEGKFFRAKGYGGYGETWVDDINKAKTYTKIGQARSRVTWFSNNYPKYGNPDIIEFSVTSGVVLDEGARVEKAKLAKQKKENEYRLRNLKRNIDKLTSDLGQYESQQKELEKLRLEMKKLEGNG